MRGAEIHPGNTYKAKTGYPLYGAVVHVLDGVFGSGGRRWKVEILMVFSYWTVQCVGDREVVTAGSLARPWLDEARR